MTTSAPRFRTTWHWLGLALLLLILDQVTKVYFNTQFAYGERVNVLPFFDFTLMYNRGAAFSFLASEAGWQRWFFAAIAIVVSVVLVVWLKRLKRHETLLAVALAMVLGGALGNLYDRVVLGHVVDFILVHWQSLWFFPAFNLADTFITIGAILLALDMFKSDKSAKEAAQ